MPAASLSAETAERPDHPDQDERATRWGGARHRDPALQADRFAVTQILVSACELLHQCMPPT
jgi:hypothetical protein